LVYPIGLLALSYDLHPQLGMGVELGAGSYRGATAVIAGARLPIYLFGDYRFAIWLCPFIRGVAMRYRDAESLRAPPTGSAHSATSIVFLDVEHARANGSSALVPGLQAGAR